MVFIALARPCKNFRSMILPKHELDEIVDPPTVQVYPEVHETSKRPTRREAAVAVASESIDY